VRQNSREPAMNDFAAQADFVVPEPVPVNAAPTGVQAAHTVFVVMETEQTSHSISYWHVAVWQFTVTPRTNQVQKGITQKTT
jgi:hypothetical protein